jgi:hypothetical protein
MRLPDHIYQAVREPFAHHATWHIARIDPEGHGPGSPFPELRGLDEPGCGEQFLRFHRDMVRVFKWVVENTPGPAFAYEPWPRLPSWLEEEFASQQSGFPLAEAYDELGRLIKAGSADDLGNFIEATELSDHPARNVHNLSHGLIHVYEVRTLGAEDPRLEDAGMDGFPTAPHNEHFWGLHGWIDNLFADWQVQHGETVDQSPLPPEESEHAHFSRRARSNPSVAKLLTPEKLAWRFSSFRR